MDGKNRTRSQILVLIPLVVLSFAFWNSIFIYPIKLFVVMLHEFSHGLAAILTGGSVSKIIIDERIGGMAYTMGGWPFIIASAGYLGSMILGSIILRTALSARWAGVLARFTGLFLIAVSALFVRNVFGLVYGIGFGIVLLILTKWLPRLVLQTFLLYLGAISCLYALVDIQEDLFTLQARQTDASILASMTGIPALAWGVLWGVLSLAVFLFTIRTVYRTGWK
jgi:hypothetical protein